jgi:DNA (cytosine-5)-methyltransferase 1
MPKAIEVFSGCGGLSSGLELAGFRILSAVEIDSTASATYRLNHPNVDLINRDIRTVKASYFLKKHNLKRGELDLLAGCSPCQGFSKLRRDINADNDPRNQLVFEYLRLVRGLLPKTIMMENVPGLINTERGQKIFEPVIKELGKLGYYVDYHIIDTANYGIPQFRKRFVLLGSRYKLHPITLPNKTHENPTKIKQGDNLKAWITVRDAFNGLPILQNGEEYPNLSLHRCSKNGSLNLQRIQAIPHNGGSRSSLPNELVLKCHRKYPNGYRDVYGRMSLDRPSPTLTSGCTNITRGRFIHPEEDRGISLLEAALLQTFNPNYKFKGNFGQISLQIGNAVPVQLGHIMGDQLVQCLHKINKNIAKK